MDNKQSLYYALGILAYSIAKADGKIQQEELDEIHQIVREETNHQVDFNYAEIIFKLLLKDKSADDSVHSWALDALEQGKYYLSEKVKEQFITVLVRVSKAFPPKTDEEHNMLNQFIAEIRSFKVNNTIE